MADDNIVQQILEGARKFADQKRAEGWTQQDFARELSKFFKEDDNLNTIRASGQPIIIDSLTAPLINKPFIYPPYININ